MESLARTMVRFRWVVIAAWTVIILVSGVLSAGLSDLLTNRFLLPGTETERAEKILEKHFGQKSTGAFTLVVKGEPGSAKVLLPQVKKAANRAVKELPTGRIASVDILADNLVVAQLNSNLEPAKAKTHTAAMRDAAKPIGTADVMLSGQAAIEHDLDPVFAHDLKVGEVFIAIPVALLILVWVFGTLAFLIPFVFSLAAIPPTLAIIWVLAHYMQLATYLQNMVMLIGLGIAIDYSLLVVHRYREEHEAGGSRVDAIARTMATAGRAVVFSGTAVAIGLALMLFMPLPFMRGFGIGGLIVPIMSIICALTLLPVLLYYLVPPLDRIRLIPKRVIDHRIGSEHNFWLSLSQRIMRRPWRFTIISAVLLLAIASPIFALEVGPGSNKGIPQKLEGVRGLNIISNTIKAGALAPTTVVIDAGSPGAAKSAPVEGAVTRLAGMARKDPESAKVTVEKAFDPTGQYRNIQIAGKSEYGSPSALDFAHRLRDTYIPASEFPASTQVYAGGGPPSGVDFLHLTYSSFPWLVLAVLILTYFLLLRAFRSLLIPLKAIILNLLSISAAYGLMVLIFKWGLGEIVGIISSDQIEGWIPVFVFAMVFGLSMDYEVFLVSRMREEWDNGKSNEEAVASGLAKTGRIVTAAGAVMFAAFMGFLAGSIVGLQQFGLGLGAAILIDVTLVRALLVPSVMKLFGRWNWWLPVWVARIMRVEPSPLNRPRPA